MNKITISTGHPDAGRVYAEAYEEALAREDELREELAGLEHWRDLALQFDNHRMKALWHLKTLVSDIGHYDAARNFLSEPPIQASALQQRLTVAEQREGVLEGLLRDTKTMLSNELSYELFAKIAQHIKRIDAALKPAAEKDLK